MSVLSCLTLVEYQHDNFLFLPSLSRPHSPALTASGVCTSKPLAAGILVPGCQSLRWGNSTLLTVWRKFIHLWMQNCGRRRKLHRRPSAWQFFPELSTCSGRLRPDQQVHCLSRYPTSAWDAILFLSCQCFCLCQDSLESHTTQNGGYKHYNPFEAKLVSPSVLSS